jgi:hypothetical protein
MGLVFLGRDLRLDRPVAIKVVLPRAGEEGAGLESSAASAFAEEARIGAGLTHPAIATVFDFGLNEGSPFTVFEYIPGETLRDLLRRRGRLELDEVRMIVATLAQALDFAHGRRVVHRDLKPENVRATEQGQFKVLDLGLAKDFRRQEDWTFCGTPAYASPEQARGEPCDGRADQYALAIIAFEMLTGRRPFEGKSWRTLLEMHAKAEPPRPSALRPDLPDAIGEAILRALDKDPNRRFATCEEFAVALGCQFLSAPAPLPEILLEADLAGMSGHVRARQASFNLFSTKIHVLLSSEALWIAHRSELTRLPLGAITGVRRHYFSRKLRLTLNGTKGETRQVFSFRRRRECYQWYERLRGLIEDRMPDPEARVEGSRIEPVVLLPSRPVARFQMLGPLEARGRKRWSVRAGLQIRGAMVGADAVVDVQEERLAGFHRTERRVSGASLKAVDGDGRAELKLRWFDGEAARLGLWITLTMGLSLIGALAYFAFQVVPRSSGSGRGMALPATGVVMTLVPFLLGLGLRVARWPQLARPAAIGLFGLGGRILLGMITIVAIPIVVAFTALGPNSWDRLKQGDLGNILFLPFLGLVVLGVSIPSVGYLYWVLYLGRRAWRTATELRRATPDAPRRAPLARKVLGAVALGVSATYAVGVIGIELLGLGMIGIELLGSGSTRPRASIAPPASTRPNPGPTPPVPSVPTEVGKSTGEHEAASINASRHLIELQGKVVRERPDELVARQDLARFRADLAMKLATATDPSHRDPAEAVALAEAAVAADPRNPRLQRTLGIARYRRGDADTAISALETARELGAGEDPTTTFYLAMSCQSRGRHDLALMYLDQGLVAATRRKGPDSELDRLKEEAVAQIKPAGGVK